MPDEKDGLHERDPALLRAATTGEGAVVLTPDLLQKIQDNLTARYGDIDELYPKLVEACPNEMKLAVVAWAMKHIVEHAREGGSYRTLIYDRLEFGMDAYVPLCADGMTISNEFTITEPTENDARLAKAIERAFENLPVGDERSDLVNARYRLTELSAALTAEQEKRRRIEAALKEEAV